ncbi:hypothetical protein HRI_005203300 [Hibiscus trionum]|uniref:Endonuclease/exonuclease/phosphatase domain-containing protein n=1 Tax=Hibiscus trionum TaxID=183268 RepID=A0A9W7MXT1_HIBTR|nr:hypothetical protein HRI_005203300 [Hibiscus trionum]
MVAFSEFIDDLKLVDLPKFTWSSLRDSPSYSRLDRFLLSVEFVSRWPSLIQHTLARGISDHNHVKLSISSLSWGPKPFKWFHHWGDDKDLLESLKKVQGS